MSVTAVDLAVVTIESLVAQDISDYSQRRLRGAGAQAPAQQAPVVLLPTAPSQDRTAVLPGLVVVSAASVSVQPSAPTHSRRTPAGRRLAQVH